MRITYNRKPNNTENPDKAKNNVLYDSERVVEDLRFKRNF